MGVYYFKYISLRRNESQKGRREGVLPGPHRRKYLQVGATLKDLGTDYLDLYLVSLTPALRPRSQGIAQ